MPSVLETIAKAQGGQAITNLAHTYGLSPQQAQAVLEATLPRFAQAIEKNTLSRGGLSDLVRALGQGHHGVYLENPAALGHPQTIAEGNAILGHILGTKDASRGVAGHVARTTGLDETLIKSMLPTVATWIMGGMAQDTKLGFGDILGRMGIPMPGNFGNGGGVSINMPELPNVPADPMGLPEPQQPSGYPPTGYPTQQRRNDGPFGGNTGGWGQQDQAPEPGQRPYPGQKQNPYGGQSGYPEPNYPEGVPPPRPQPRAQPRPMPRGGPGAGGGMGRDGGMGGGGYPMPQQMPPDLPGTGGTGNNPYGDLADILRKGLGLPGGGGMGGGGMPMPRQTTNNGGPGGGGGFPFPMPQGRGPGAGGGGGGLPSPMPQGNVGGGILWNIVRSVLGQSMGFQNRGVMGWIINFLIMRFAWPLIRSILGRVLTGGR